MSKLNIKGENINAKRSEKNKSCKIESYNSKTAEISSQNNKDSEYAEIGDYLYIEKGNGYDEGNTSTLYAKINKKRKIENDNSKIATISSQNIEKDSGYAEIGDYLCTEKDSGYAEENISTLYAKINKKRKIESDNSKIATISSQNTEDSGYAEIGDYLCTEKDNGYDEENTSTLYAKINKNRKIENDNSKIATISSQNTEDSEYAEIGDYLCTEKVNGYDEENTSTLYAKINKNRKIENDNSKIAAISSQNTEKDNGYAKIDDFIFSENHDSGYAKIRDINARGDAYIKMEIEKRYFLLNYLNIIKSQIIDISNNCIDSNLYNVLKQYRNYFQKKQDSKIKNFFKKSKDIRTINKIFINKFVISCDEILKNSKPVGSKKIKNFSIKNKNLDKTFLYCIVDINHFFWNNQLAISNCEVVNDIKIFFDKEFKKINNSSINCFIHDKQTKEIIKNVLSNGVEKIDALEQEKFQSYKQNQDTNNIVQVDNIKENLAPAEKQDNTLDLEQEITKLKDQNSTQSQISEIKIIKEEEIVSNINVKQIESHSIFKQAMQVKLIGRVIPIISTNNSSPQISHSERYGKVQEIKGIFELGSKKESHSICKPIIHVKPSTPMSNIQSPQISHSENIKGKVQEIKGIFELGSKKQIESHSISKPIMQVKPSTPIMSNIPSTQSSHSESIKGNVQKIKGIFEELGSRKQIENYSIGKPIMQIKPSTPIMSNIQSSQVSHSESIKGNVQKRKEMFESKISNERNTSCAAGNIFPSFKYQKDSASKFVKTLSNQDYNIKSFGKSIDHKNSFKNNNFRGKLRIRIFE